MKFSLIFNKEDLHRSKRGSITAPIYFALGEYCFPGNRWSDFVVVILCWWLKSLSKIVNGWETEVDFEFMDGPMLIRISKIEDDKLKLECVNQRKTVEVIERTITITQSSLVEELLKIAQEVIKSCDELGWESDDTRLLKKEIDCFS